jgi:hypothetical protein
VTTLEETLNKLLDLDQSAKLIFTPEQGVYIITNKVRYRGGFCVSCHVTGGGAYREIFALLRQVSLSSVPKQAGECVKKTVTPGVEVQKSLYKPHPLSRDMKQKNIIGVVACPRVHVCGLEFRLISFVVRISRIDHYFSQSPFKEIDTAGYINHIILS